MGTRDCKELLLVFAVVNLVEAALNCNSMESPARAKQEAGKSKTRRFQEAVAAHLRPIPKSSRNQEFPRTVRLAILEKLRSLG